MSESPCGNYWLQSLCSDDIFATKSCSDTLQSVRNLWTPQFMQNVYNCVVFFSFLLLEVCYVGTAVSRLRRPCLSLRLLLYRAISSKAEVAGSGVGISTSGLTAHPTKHKGKQSSFLGNIKCAEKRTGQ